MRRATRGWEVLGNTLGIALLGCGVALSGAWAAELPAEGTHAATVVRLEQQLAAQPDDHAARFELGATRALVALERLAQAQYRHGALHETFDMLPILRMPLPRNPAPQPIDYAQTREILSALQRDLLAAEAELARVDLTREVQLRWDLAELGLDVDGDGKLAREERLLMWFNAVNRRAGAPADGPVSVAFDNGDVPWLRGYCHFLAAVCDVALAYDAQELFDVCGGLVYPDHVPSRPVAASLPNAQPGFETTILDVIAAIHLIDFKLQEPERMRSAHAHLLAMIRLSRESWDLILAETDDDDEWLPNPQQHGRLEIPVTQSMIDSWRGVLAEMEEILEGRKLVPFWRDYVRVLGPGQPIPETGRGVNLRRVFHEPADFDLVLTLQGTAVVPYLEEGPLSRPETWNNLLRVFRGQFFGFAMWFN